ncbi:MAG: PLP-dependent aspartate aminotransferase family protein [Thermoplasmata archaeon]|nr:PLP-dependent aspartate aminotransferase family protein [Thermoplasmata archaeon]MCI4358970.1 PLP-dependent aspartate aminotransferase family protein [Thermoplasmata archaeon]
MRFSTKAIHAGQPPDELTGAVNVPVYLSSTYAQSAPNRTRGYSYSRSGNPTRAVLERALAQVEGGRTGLAFSSGLGALATLLGHFPSGSRIVAIDDLYGGSWRLFEHHRRQFGVQTEYVDMTRLGPLVSALQKPTDLVYLETPTNPLMRIADLGAIARVAHRAGALMAVDNTFATPALQRPIERGADVVLHSTTKYLGGHSDIIGGALVLKSRSLGEKLRWLQNAIGAVPSPFDCFLVLRGLHTLAIRMRAHGESARAVAEVLEASARIRSVHYPGLRSHPQHALARRQMDGFGGMLSAELKGGLAEARRFLRRLKVFTLAESLGGVESLIDHPALMTHASVPRAERESRGISGGLLRLSCGIEDPSDLADDVRSALRDR